MNVLVIYKNGSHREIRPSYIPLESEDFCSQIEDDFLDTSEMKTVGIRYYRSYWSTYYNERYGLNNHEIPVIVTPEEYPSIYQIQVNGMVLFENDGNGNLRFASDVFDSE